MSRKHGRARPRSPITVQPVGENSQNSPPPAYRPWATDADNCRASMNVFLWQLSRRPGHSLSRKTAGGRFFEIAFWPRSEYENHTFGSIRFHSALPFQIFGPPQRGRKNPGMEKRTREARRRREQSRGREEKRRCKRGEEKRKRRGRGVATSQPKARSKTKSGVPTGWVPR